MHQQLRQVSVPSQDGDLDYATMVAEFDAIVRAPRKPLPAKHEITGINRALNRALGGGRDAMPAPSLLEEFEAWATALEAATLDPKSPASAPPPAKSELPAIVARIAGIMAGAANDDEISPPTAPSFVPDLVTKTYSRLRRKSGLRQSADARKMRDAGRVARGEAVKHPAPFHHTHTCSTNDNAKPQTKRARRERGLAPWDDAGELPRIIAVNRAVAEMGIPFAWSLNLGPAQIQAANDNARGFLDHLRRKVARYLKNELRRSASFWFVLETDATGRPHLHGGLVLNDNDDPAAVERALAKAGGAASSQGSKPADIRPQHDPDGWAAYSTKRIGRTKRHLRDLGDLDPEDHVAIWTCTSDLRAAGKCIHEDARLLALQPRLRPSAVPASRTAPVSLKPASGAVMRDALRPTQERYPHHHQFILVSVPSIHHPVRIDQHGPDPPSRLTTVNPRATNGNDTRSGSDRPPRHRHLGMRCGAAPG